jgi:pimeloyl-ACP methyl ester carboxylesterase
MRTMDRSAGRNRAEAWARRAVSVCLVMVIVFAGTGCGSGMRSPKVIFLDGAGYYGSHFSVRRGLERAGYIGGFERFAWSSWLGPGADHLVAARSLAKAHRLRDHIVDERHSYPHGKIYLMGLSAGTAVILGALADLPRGIDVDGVVLFSSSVSSRRNLVPALKHIRGRLYATCSTRDAILSALPVNADDGMGRPVGLRGFLLPTGLGREEEALYAKVVNIPWQPSYVGFGWHGGHVQATTASFVENVIAPRVMSAEPYPLDRPLVDVKTLRSTVKVGSGWELESRWSGRSASVFFQGER